MLFRSLARFPRTFGWIRSSVLVLIDIVFFSCPVTTSSSGTGCCVPSRILLEKVLYFSVIHSNLREVPFLGSKLALSFECLVASLYSILNLSWFKTWLINVYLYFCEDLFAICIFAVLYNIFIILFFYFLSAALLLYFFFSSFFSRLLEPFRVNG